MEPEPPSGTVPAEVPAADHVYSHSLGESLERERTVTRREFAAIARREAAIPLAAVAPITMLVLGALGIIGEGTAVWIALAIGVVTLGAQGIRYARAEHLGVTATIVAVSVNVALGLVIVAMVSPAALAIHSVRVFICFVRGVSSTAVADSMPAILPTSVWAPTPVTIMTALPWVTGVCMNAMFS